VQAVAPPLRLDGHRLVHRAPPPLLGEHSREVLRELGYDEQSIDALVEQRVVTSRP
jgi:crotonobetainyl-CoA:carnitine CoA-transferase CaiB-like acyl-CoA transferase